MRRTSMKIRINRAASPSANPVDARDTHQIQTVRETFFRANWDISNATIARVIPQ